MGCQHGKGQRGAGNWSASLLIQTGTDAHQPLPSQLADLMSPVVSSSPNTPVTRGKLCTGLLLAPHASHLHAPSWRIRRNVRHLAPGRLLMGTLTGEN